MSEQPKKPRKLDDPNEEAEQARQIAKSSDDEDSKPELARDRQPRPDDAKKVEKSIKKSSDSD